MSLGWGGVHSHFHVQPIYSVEVVLCFVVVGVVTITMSGKFGTMASKIIAVPTLTSKDSPDLSASFSKMPADPPTNPCQQMSAFGAPADVILEWSLIPHKT